jgi:hypothetical protein
MTSIRWYVNRIRDLISLAWHLFRNLLIVIVLYQLTPLTGAGVKGDRTGIEWQRKRGCHSVRQYR